MEITLLLIASCSLLQMSIGNRTQSKSRYQQDNVRFRSHAVQFPYCANKPSPRGLLYNKLGSVEHADNSVAGGGEGVGGVGGRRWTQCAN